MVPAFWIWVGKFRRYGRQLREYPENVWGMCQCRGACFFDVGGKKSWLREPINNICCEYGGNVPASWCLHFGFGLDIFVGTGDNSENILKMCGECASVVPPAFLMWVGTFRGYGTQLKEYVVNIWEMCQHHGACFLDLGGTFS
jgi:hypothetical protein